MFISPNLPLAVQFQCWASHSAHGHQHCGVGLHEFLHHLRVYSEHLAESQYHARPTQSKEVRKDNIQVIWLKGKIVDEGNTNQPKRRARLIWDLKAPTTSPAKQDSSKEFQQCAHAATYDLLNCTVWHLRTARYLEWAETTRRVSLAGTRTRGNAASMIRVTTKNAKHAHHQTITKCQCLWQHTIKKTKMRICSRHANRRAVL